MLVRRSETFNLSRWNHIDEKRTKDAEVLCNTYNWLRFILTSLPNVLQQEINFEGGVAGLKM